MPIIKNLNEKKNKKKNTCLIVIPDFGGLLLENCPHIVFIVAAAEILTERKTV